MYAYPPAPTHVYPPALIFYSPAQVAPAYSGLAHHPVPSFCGPVFPSTSAMYPRPSQHGVQHTSNGLSRTTPPPSHVNCPSPAWAYRPLPHFVPSLPRPHLLPFLCLCQFRNLPAMGLASTRSFSMFSLISVARLTRVVFPSRCQLFVVGPNSSSHDQGGPALHFDRGRGQVCFALRRHGGAGAALWTVTLCPTHRIRCISTLCRVYFEEDTRFVFHTQEGVPDCMGLRDVHTARHKIPEGEINDKISHHEYVFFCLINFPPSFPNLLLLQAGRIGHQDCNLCNPDRPSCATQSTCSRARSDCTANSFASGPRRFCF